MQVNSKRHSQYQAPYQEQEDSGFRPMTQSPPNRAGSSMAGSNYNGYTYDGKAQMPKTQNVNRNIKINQTTFDGPPQISQEYNTIEVGRERNTAVDTVEGQVVEPDHS